MSTDQTPSLARATEALHNEPLPRENDGSFSPERYATNLARAVVSAALHDPDDPAWPVSLLRDHDSLRTERFGIEPDGWYCDGCGVLLAPRDVAKTVRQVMEPHRANVMRAAILGEAS